MSVPVPAPRIRAFESLGFGMFIHWGLYSQLGRGEWVRHFERIPLETYDRLQTTFTASRFDADAIARLAKEAGCRYITLTTRHHEGFSLYDTKGLNTFDAPHSPAGRDLVREYVEACRPLVHRVSFEKVAAHTGVKWNEAVDKLAKDAIARAKKGPAPVAPKVEPVAPAAAPAEPIPEPIKDPKTGQMSLPL